MTGEGVHEGKSRGELIHEMVAMQQTIENQRALLERRGNGNSLEVTGPGRWGFVARGSFGVFLGVVAVILLGTTGVNIWLVKTALARTELEGALAARLPRSEAEHTAIITGLRRTWRAIETQTCVNALSLPDREWLRKNWSPPALKGLCPWIDGTDLVDG